MPVLLGGKKSRLTLSFQKFITFPSMKYQDYPLNKSYIFTGCENIKSSDSVKITNF